MKVCLIDVDSKIPNLALMKISAWHKSQGDQVKLFDPIFDKPDLAYASKVFKFTEDFQYWPECEVIIGGSGYDLETVLPYEIEHLMPDYSLYQNADYAIGLTSRGCTRSCGYCIVPQKEGKFTPVADIYEFWQGQKHIMLIDNNLTADSEHFAKIVKQLIKEKLKVDFSSGLDIRLIDDEKAKLLTKVSLWKQLRFAWDSMDLEQDVLRGIEILTKHMSASRLMFYVLIGWDTTEDEDLYRVEMLRSLKVDPFVMPYDKHNEYQRRFARYVNHKAVFKSCSWPEYQKKC